MNYFNNIHSLDEAKKRFYDLAKTHHPDKGGDTETFQEILNQFHDFVPKTEKYKGESQEWNGESYSTIILQLIQIPEVIIEVCGSWIWLHGNTKPYKEQIKAVATGDKYRRGWSKEKLMWYFSPLGYRKRSGNTLSLDEIRELYGSGQVEKKTTNQISTIL